MTVWYPAFIFALILLRWGATPRDKNALSIVMVASFVSVLLVTFVTHQISGAWKLVIPAGLEVLTIAAMLKWSRNRTGYMQAACLVVAWLTHVLCYADLQFNSDVVYSRYGTILELVAVGQLLACYETMSFNLGRAYRYTANLWNGRSRHIPAASVCDSVLRAENPPGV